MIRRLACLLLCAQPLALSEAHAGPGPGATVFSNPVIPGFAPDPSIVRVDSDFYLVNSSFEYFPGIPVYHSRDLVNWELISYAIHDPAQAELYELKSSDGIHASTIRFHDGLFFVITTNNVDGRMTNFIVTASDPRGPWSRPYVLDGAPGIDPSLFFDDDGRAWYVGNHIPPDPEFEGQAEIWLQELALGAMQLTGKRYFLWRGCCQGVWAEGPHIYKKDGFYYLLISEGGTAYEHALSVAISDDIRGPYRNNPRNPVLSHRQLSYDTPITGVGHADLVELEDGRWYAVVLGWRLVDGRHGILGRETFLVPLVWETEPYTWKARPPTYPVFSPETGRVELRFPSPFADTPQRDRGTFRDDFDAPALGLEWNFRRAPRRQFPSLAAEPGALRLRLQPGALAERAQYSFVGIRQRHFEFRAETRMIFAPSPGEEAGLLVVQNDKAALLLALAADASGQSARLIRHQHGDAVALADVPFDGDAIYLRVTGNYLDYRFDISADGERWRPVGDVVDGTVLSPYRIEGYNYTGVYIGLYGSSNGAESENHADFDFFEYTPTAADRDAWYRRQEARFDAD